MIHLFPEMHIVRCLHDFVPVTLFNVTTSICVDFFSGLGLFSFFSLRSSQKGWAGTLCNAYWNWNASKNRHLWTFMKIRHILFCLLILLNNHVKVEEDIVFPRMSTVCSKKQLCSCATGPSKGSPRSSLPNR